MNSLSHELAVAAWRQAAGWTGPIEELPPRTQYAVRRIGGQRKLNLEGCSYQFTQAFNEAPIVDCDLDTVEMEEILVRGKEPKDGV